MDIWCAWANEQTENILINKKLGRVVLFTARGTTAQPQSNLIILNSRYRLSLSANEPKKPINLYKWSALRLDPSKELRSKEQTYVALSSGYRLCQCAG